MSEIAPSPFLYHYTTIAGFLGIVRDEHIWATDARYSNDSTELHLFLDAVRNGAEKKDLSPEWLEWARGFVSFIQWMMPTSLVCVACFTEREDDLSQWRAYAARGQGIAIRINRERLQKLADAKEFKLVECRYTQEQLNLEVEDTLMHMVHAWETRRPYRPLAATYQLSAGAMIERILALASRFKHPSFQDEQEWRLIAEPWANQPVKFREGTFTVIPYIEFPLRDDGGLLIEGAVVGPTREPNLAKATVAMALKLDAHFVVNSIIPYRSLL